MNSIPLDAIHWDSGDWIEWHRHEKQPANASCMAPSEDPRARLFTLRTRMLQSARAYFDLTREHLCIYDQIGQIHAGLTFDLPWDGTSPIGTVSKDAQIITLPPDGDLGRIQVDMTRPFEVLIVVRIPQNFTPEARIMPRTALPDQQIGTFELHWSDMPMAP